MYERRQLHSDGQDLPWVRDPSDAHPGSPDRRQLGNPEATYELSKHAFVCKHDEEIIILDLRNDRYLSVEAQNASLLSPHILGWPMRQPSPSAISATDAAQTHEALRLLSDRGLVATTKLPGVAKTPVSVPPPSVECVSNLNERPRINFKDVLNFVRAAAGAALVLRLCSLERIVESVKKRRAYTVHGARPPDLAEVRRLVAAFGILRPYFVSAQDACLFESLALFEFLRRYGIDFHLVFGVRTGPFAAHCWLQQDDIVANDCIDAISRYTPIMIA